MKPILALLILGTSLALSAPDAFPRFIDVAAKVGITESYKIGFGQVMVNPGMLFTKMSDADYGNPERGCHPNSFECMN